MDRLLIFLSGKKSSIATLIMGVIAYLAAKEMLGEPEVVLATLICLVLFGTASHFTGKIFNQ